MRTEDYKREFSIIFFAQSRIILGTTLLITVLAILIAFLWPPTYSATGSILVRGKKVERSPGALEEVQRQISLFPLTKEDLSSEIQILTSPDVIEMTIKKLDEQMGQTDLRQKPLVDQIYRIKKRLDTEIAPASNVIAVTYYSKSPTKAVSTLQTLMDQYIKYRTQVDNPPQVETFYTKQADRYKEALDNTDDQMLALVEKNRAASPETEIQNNLLIKKDLVQQLNVLKNEAIEKELYIQLLDSALQSKNIQYFSFVENESIRQLSNKLQELSVERGLLLRKYVPGSEMVQAIDRQIENTFGSLKTEVASYKADQKNQLKIINDKLQSMNTRIAAIEQKNVDLERQVLEEKRIALKANLLQSSYETFAKRKEEAQMLTSASVAGANVSILTKAFPSDGPVFPRKAVVIPLGIIIGFITGCCFGLLREFFDHTFKKPSDVQKYAGLPVLFSVPEVNARPGS